MPEPPLVVDVQQCFMNDFTRHVPQRLARLIGTGRFDPLLFTRFVNSPESPYRRFLDWHDCAEDPDTSLAKELQGPAKHGRIFVKHGIAGLPDELVGYLRDHEITSLAVAGIDTDMCVLKSAMDVFDLGIRPIVMVDCCASTMGLYAHLAGLAVLSRNIGPHQLRDEGLGEGRIGAPEGGAETGEE